MNFSHPNHTQIPLTKTKNQYPQEVLKKLLLRYTGDSPLFIIYRKSPIEISYLKDFQ